MAMVLEQLPLTRIRVTAGSNFLTEETSVSHTPADIGEIFPQPQSNDEKTLSEIHPLWRRNLFAVLEQPKSSSSAFLLHTLSTFLIVFSALVTVLETVPTFHIISVRAWFGVETSIVALFTVEYIARCFAWSSSWLSLLKWITCTCLVVVDGFMDLHHLQHSSESSTSFPSLPIISNCCYTKILYVRHCWWKRIPLTSPHTSVNFVPILYFADVPLNTCIQAISLQQYSLVVRLI
jgi:hypothetical protein